MISLIFFIVLSIMYIFLSFKIDKNDFRILDKTSRLEFDYVIENLRAEIKSLDKKINSKPDLDKINILIQSVEDRVLTVITIDDKEKISEIEQMDSYKECQQLCIKVKELLSGSTYPIAFSVILGVLKGFILEAHVEGLKSWEDCLNGCIKAVKADIEFSLERIRMEAH